MGELNSINVGNEIESLPNGIRKLDNLTYLICSTKFVLRFFKPEDLKKFS
jgi:Leucine-rich repeat (LRR) protein